MIFQHYARNDYHYCAGPSGCEPAGPAAAWVQRAYYVSRQDITPQLYADGRGGLVVFAAGETNAAVNRWDSGQRRWQSLGGRTNGPLVSYTHADGTAGLMARDPLGGVWANKQRHDGTWQGWQALGGMRVAQIPVVAPQATRPPWRWATTTNCIGSRRRASTAAGVRGRPCRRWTA